MSRSCHSGPTFQESFIQHLCPSSRSSLWSRQSPPRSGHPACLVTSLFYSCPKGKTVAAHVEFMPHSYPHVQAGQSPWLHPGVPKYHADAPRDTLSPVIPNKSDSQFSHRDVRNSVSWTFCPVSSGLSHTLLSLQLPQPLTRERSWKYVGQTHYVSCAYAM